MNEKGRREKRYSVVILLVVATVGVVLALSALRQISPPSANPDDREQVALGRTIYVSTCASCHGQSLEGQSNWRTQLATGGYPAPPHDETGHTWHHPDELLFRITKHGGDALGIEGVKSNMPHFMNVLTDEEIWAVLAYIKSSWPDELLRRQLDTNRQASG